MNRLFFYGTLRHQALLEMVIGRAVEPGELKPVRLPDHQVFWASGQIFPLIQAAPGEFADGQIFIAGTEELARLNFYEGGFNYDLQHLVCEGETETSEVYFPQPDRWQTGAPWSHAEFIRDHGDHTLRTARGFMRLFGLVSRDEAMRRLPMIRAMAAKSYQTGEFAPLQQRSGLDTGQVELLGHSRPYDAFFAMDEIDLRHARFDGKMSKPMRRGVLVSVDAVMLLPYDPRRDRVLLIEQFRTGPFLRGDPAPWMLEPIAGRIDHGEDAQTAARREAREEAGLTLSALVPVNGHYPSPGISSEYYHCFLGICDLPDGSEGLGGIESEDEDIRSQLFSFDALMALLDSGEAEVGPLVLLALWLARHRGRLRRECGDIGAISLPGPG